MKRLFLSFVVVLLASPCFAQRAASRGSIGADAAIGRAMRADREDKERTAEMWKQAANQLRQRNAAEEKMNEDAKQKEVNARNNKASAKIVALKEEMKTAQHAKEGDKVRTIKAAITRLEKGQLEVASIGGSDRIIDPAALVKDGESYGLNYDEYGGAISHAPAKRR
jgi:anti-sigma28 factor (negative regulator of flagellin synthesis)